MLRLTEITKDYPIADGYVHALKGVSLSFRKNEFVSILGASGCGKTTLLNIIGGLDKYTSGDLIINGVSTKKFGDKDWDTYRNHSIGFIFQSYHLIPHQTILQNVELALTISGVSKEERRRRAIEALDKVGLKDRIHNKPNQLSGGQAQRVAIARALINDPEIVLADEPTGALDSVTSVQIMDLLKEISKDRLVIMVTHNPELADKYSTRIIRLLDGEVTGDTMPYSEEEEIAETEARKAEDKPVVNKGKKKRSSMSFGMAFMLSLKNLLSKIKRTTMVAFAGSIGIIGVSMVLAISAGVQGYIDDMQDDMLAGNPIVVAETAFDANSLMNSMPVNEQSKAWKVEDGVINVSHMVEFLYERGQVMNNIFVSNDIDQKYIDYIKAMPEHYYAALDFNYGLDLSNNIYTEYKFTNHENVMSISAARQMFVSMLGHTEFAEYASYVNMISKTFSQMPDNADFILSQYEYVTDPKTSRIATKEDEIMIVVNDEHELSDLLLAQLGYYSQEEFFDIVDKATADTKDENDPYSTYDINALMSKEFTWYSNKEVYSPNLTASNEYERAAKPFFYNPIENKDWKSGKKLKLTGILILKEGQNYGCLSSGFYYTSALSQAILKDSAESLIVQTLKALNIATEGKVDSFVGMEDYIVRDDDGNIMYDDAGKPLYAGPTGITYEYTYSFDGVDYSQTGFVGNQSAMASIMSSLLGGLFGSGAQYTLTLRELGGVNIPNTINIYPLDFDHKDLVTDYLDAWNSNATITVNGVEYTAEERSRIVYTDTVGLIINMINTMIKMITIALIAFTALSLVVSTVMVGIITYVSVVERVKEIGILRAVGARKRDVKHLFNAETFIIGLAAGVVGIAVTYILSFIVNMIIGSLTGIYTIAALPIWQAFIMIGVSIVLTLISGLIPASSAAKKDPVVALRTE